MTSELSEYLRYQIQDSDVQNSQAWFNITGEHICSALQEVTRQVTNIFYHQMSRKAASLKNAQKSLQIIEKNDPVPKMKLINEILYQENPDNYTSFVVCRDPLDKLVSVFNYLCQRFSDKEIHNSELRNSTLTRNWPSFTAAVRDNNPLPTWKQFLEIVASDFKVGDFFYFEYLVVITCKNI